MLNTIYRDNLFAGKVALVTGGGTGIGLRTARELAALGAKVVLASRNKDHLDVGLAQLPQGSAHALVCDIRSETSVIQCVKDALDWGGTLDFLVNNAGGQYPSPAAQINQKGWNAVIETNLTGTFLMTREVFNQAMCRKGGAIVNVIANMWKGFPMMAHTGAARAGVDNLTKTWAVEWGRFGVRVNAVAPGVIRSSGLDRYDPKFQPLVESCAKNNQAWRLGTEEEVASSILFLLSPAASFITGETLRVDGGDSLYSPLMPPSENDRHSPYKDT